MSCYTSGHTSGDTAGPHGRAHPVVRTLVHRQLTVGLVHSFAGSGAIAALAFAELPGAGRGSST